MKALYLKNGLVFTTGFSRMSERQYSLREEEHLGEPIVIVELDTSNGDMFPLYDPDVNLIYLCGKGDSVIRYFEVTDEPPFVHYINTFQSPEPQRGIGMMPKRGCDVNQCEIARFYQLHTKGYCEVITMTVPRKSELFQDDLYPDTLSDTPPLSAEEWFAGKELDPIMMSLKGGYIPPKQADFKVTKKSNVLDKMPNKPPSSSAAASNAAAASAAASAAAAAVAEKMQSKIDEILDDVKRLKTTVLKHEARIRDLERKLAEKEGGPTPSHPQLTSAAAAVAAKVTAAANAASSAAAATNNGDNAHNASEEHELAPDEV